MTHHHAPWVADAFARPDDMPAAYALIHEFALSLAAAGFDPSALADALLAEGIALRAALDGCQHRVPEITTAVVLAIEVASHG